MKGDLVELRFDNPSRTDHKIVGIVENVFDALTSTGQPDLNLEIDIRYGKNNTKWFRYKPMLDGGTIRVIDPKEYND